MNDQPARGREAELEAMLTAANRQLLERDEELLEIARDRELVHARETLQRFEQQVNDLNTAIAEMQATRAWRTAERIRSIRRGLLGRLPNKG